MFTKMATIWENIVDKCTNLMEDSHPLTKDFLLIRSPLLLPSVLIIYNIFCIIVGPMLMKNRPPYKLKTIMKVYNILQVIINMYITYEGYVYIFSGNFNFQCQAVRDNDDRVAGAIYVYLIVKLVELLDTVFFVLRKSYRQVTFLHLYHHTLMPIVTWVGITYSPGGQGVILGAINAFVHVVMYCYYFISGLGPQYQKYLWWKQYLTVLQIMQFMVILLHSVYSLFYSCSYLPILKVLTIIVSGIFIYMFSKFYYVVYVVKSQRQRAQSKHREWNMRNGERNGNSHDSRETANSNDNRASGDLNAHSEVADKRITNGKIKDL